MTNTMDYTDNRFGNITTQDGRLIRLTQAAYPTSAQMATDGEEWAASADLEGIPVIVYFQFDEEEVQQASEACPYNPPEELPWGIQNVTHWTAE